jgi:hypothetical protein
MCADWHGLTFSRTPQQIIRILTMASPDSKGVSLALSWPGMRGGLRRRSVPPALPALQAFFPDGLLGEITSWQGYDAAATGVEAWPSNPRLATQVKFCSFCVHTSGWLLLRGTTGCCR